MKTDKTVKLGLYDTNILRKLQGNISSGEQEKSLERFVSICYYFYILISV
ncbi:MAG: hypothetical protein ACUBOA_06025 [Candidatus Loosdrechtia sp.]|nr:MAG: hypothetical protein QY305_09245 [Candidatus Jettenia sp. AMX2]